MKFLKIVAILFLTFLVIKLSSFIIKEVESFFCSPKIIIDKNTLVPSNKSLEAISVNLDDSIIYGDYHEYEYRGTDRVSYMFLRPVNGRKDIYFYFSYDFNITNDNQLHNPDTIAYYYDIFKWHAFHEVVEDKFIVEQDLSILYWSKLKNYEEFSSDSVRLFTVHDPYLAILIEGIVVLLGVMMLIVIILSFLHKQE